MCGSINGLKSQLRRDAPLMYNLFEILEKKREVGSKPTSEELLVASGQRAVDQLPYQLQEQLKRIGKLSESKSVSQLVLEHILVLICCRNHLIRQSLTVLLQNGLRLAISHLTRLKNLSSSV
jgi:hypothetical protein